MTIRVVQWATGAIGKTCLRAVLDDPDLQLVGLYVYSDKKEGLDAGDIARRPLTGVKATRNIDDILALDADVVLHCPLLQMPYAAHDADVCRVLESGKDVISINNYFHPASLGAGHAARLERSCRIGGSTLCGTGVNPGFIAERLAAVASGLCIDVESISCREVYDCLDMPNANYVFDVMGMGARAEDIDLETGSFAAMFNDMYRQCVGELAARLGLALDRIEPDHNLVLAPTDIAARAGLIKAGTVAATCWQFHGIRNGQRVISHSVNWVMGPTVPGFEGAHHWNVGIRGKPGIDITMDLIEPAETAVKTRAAQYAVAGMVTNAIPHVVAAAPGLFAVALPPVYRPRRTGTTQS
ncbi:MAG: hypothetical protein SFV19_01935 [Rhodospirillaceae bacterium]|nr:hypothetical protein [Rhodospirillaceae bacterium]